MKHEYTVMTPKLNNSHHSVKCLPHLHNPTKCMKFDARQRWYLSLFWTWPKCKAAFLFTSTKRSLWIHNIVRVVKSRRMRWAGHVARMGEGRGVHRVLVGKPEGKRPLGRPRCRWKDNIETDLQEVGGGCGDWMELAQDRDMWWALVNMVRNLRVPKMPGISWLAAEPVSFSRRTLAPWSK